MRTSCFFSLLFFIWSLCSFGQTVLIPYPLDKQTFENQDVYSIRNLSLRIWQSPTSGKWNLNLSDSLSSSSFSFEEPGNTDYLNPFLFSPQNPKRNNTLLLVEIGQEISYGCHVFMIDPKGATTHVGFLDVAAYSRNKEGYMNYNNISPHLSIFETNNRRWIFSFENILIVYQPGLAQERVVAGNKIYYQIQDSTIEVKWH